MTAATTPATFEGETAIHSQSGYARELLKKVVSNNPSIGQNEEVKSALSALGELVTHQGHVTVSTTSTTHPLINRSLSDVDPGKLERPPWPAVKEMLDRAMSGYLDLGYLCSSTNVIRVSYDGICGHLPFLEDAKSI